MKLAEKLSDRERQVIALVKEGKGNLEIAMELGISHQTVKNHMKTIFEKVRVSNRTELAIRAVRGVL